MRQHLEQLVTGENMAKKGTISFSEAATRAGVSRQTIYRYASKGKLSTVKRRDGSKGVQVAELERVFTLSSTSDTATETVTKPVTQSTQLQIDIARLYAELESLKAQLTRSESDNTWLKGLVDDLKRIEHVPEREPGIVTKLFKKLF